MSIREELDRLEASLVRALVQVRRSKAELFGGDQPLPVPGDPLPPDVRPEPPGSPGSRPTDPLTPPPATGAPPGRPAPPDGGRPEFRSNYIDPLVWHAIELEAPAAGLQPVTIAAIQAWESAWYTSKLFRSANNVGGVKYRPELSGLGHVMPPYEASDGNVYASWSTWQEGIKGHVRFLLQKRYDAVRATTDPLEEILAIHEAGYAEHSAEWLEGVSAIARRFLSEGHQ